MTREQIQARLAAMRRMDFAGAEALAQEILKEARIPLHALHRLLSWSGGPDWNKAQNLLRSQNELSVLPWLVVASKLTGTQQMQAMYDAYRAQEAFGQRIDGLLQQMLSSRALIPPPKPGGPVEMPPQPTRECDEAYLLLQRLAKPDGDPPDRAAFLGLSEEQRNEKIRELAHQ
jgi:hypothetical protein